jgi:hypothetical protein
VDEGVVDIDPIIRVGTSSALVFTRVYRVRGIGEGITHVPTTRPTCTYRGQFGDQRGCGGPASDRRGGPEREEVPCPDGCRKFAGSDRSKSRKPLS